ncbi:U1 small nuclear ribonucleoprotein A [Candida viswanathii]|uniref:U1 small nuclear ribonucleoprotein A n=1 Tax=Candida viswanathii TaxID=5486 RepID=A0A367YCR2_9ASCO|nr:U1 small nuclear ribonucleoprotein A [Candida viswanathii]
MPQAKRSKDTPVGKSQDTKKIKLDFTNLKPMQTLYVKNLNTKINKQVMVHNLYLLFSAFGDVISINLRQGFAFVIFAGLNLATLALRNLQNEEFFDKLLVINYAVKESSIISRTKTEVLREEEEHDDDEILPLYE